MAKNFRGGIPYALDVKRLDEAFPVPSLAEGRLIGHEEIEAVIGEKHGSQRYYGVVNSWISRSRNQNAIHLVWEPGDGLRVLDPAGLFKHGEKRTIQKIRQTVRAVKIFAWVDRARLDEMGQRRLDHQMRVAHALGDALSNSRRELAVELAPIVSLPKRKIS